MTEKEQLPEQMAFHTYKQSVPARRSKKLMDRHAGPRQGHQSEQASGMSYMGAQRVVSVPNADPSTAWNTFAQRQQERRRARFGEHRGEHKYTELSVRTYAQTGMRASSGRMKAVRRSQAFQYTSQVPVRSGRQASHRGWWWKILSMFVSGILLVWLVTFTFTSNAFRIEQISVVGTHNDTLIHTIQSMGMQGQNIFLVNIESLKSRIDALPSVDSASLSRQWPNQLIVTVAERVPVLLWQTTRGVYSVDHQGIVIAATTDATGDNRLGTVIDDKSNQQKSAGQQIYPGIHLNQADTDFAETVFDRLPKVTGVTTFKLHYNGTINANNDKEVNNGGSYIVESSDGWRAYLGNANDGNPLDNRLAELQQILAFAQKQQLNLATIDLRYGLRPVYTLQS